MAAIGTIESFTEKVRFAFDSRNLLSNCESGTTQCAFSFGLDRAAEVHGTPVQEATPPNHEVVKDQLAKIGQIQGFLAEKEYLIEGNRLDVVWRRVEKSVPTYAFEVQVGGDIYHALIKLKRAYELWNSRLFLAGSLGARPKFEELTAGTFYEIHNRVRYLEFGAVAELYRRKSDYKELEARMGIIQP